MKVHYRRYLESMTLYAEIGLKSIDAYLLEEQSCQISSRSDLKRWSLWLFLEEVAPTRTRTTR